MESTIESNSQEITTARPLVVKAYHTFPHRTIIRSPFQKRILVKYGLIAYSWKTQKWFLIHHVNTEYFKQILLGEYRNSDLPRLLNQITTDEISTLKNLSKDSFDFNQTFFDIFPNASTDDLIYAKERFFANGEGFINYKITSVHSTESGWEIPCDVLKNDRENPVDCAIRSFKDITGVEITYKEKSFFGRDPFLIQDQREESRFWLVIFMEEPKISSKDEHFWFSEEELQEILDEGKINVIQEAKELIQENFLF